MQDKATSPDTPVWIIFPTLLGWTNDRKQVLVAGCKVMPWLGDLNNLAPLTDFAESQFAEDETKSPFPVRPVERRSYSQNCVVWIKATSLQVGVQFVWSVLSFHRSDWTIRNLNQRCTFVAFQADIQKILRQARKLPEKQQHFYKVSDIHCAQIWKQHWIIPNRSWVRIQSTEAKLRCQRKPTRSGKFPFFVQELNRLRRAALSFGFTDLLEAMSQLLERECTQLPGTAHPDAALQLTHAANALRSNIATDISQNILPMRTNFSGEWNTEVRTCLLVQHECDPGEAGFSACGCSCFWRRQWKMDRKLEQDSWLRGKIVMHQKLSIVTWHHTGQAAVCRLPQCANSLVEVGTPRFNYAKKIDNYKCTTMQE